MVRLRRRRLLVVFAVGLVLCAAFVPAAAANLAALILTPLWILPAAAAITRIRRQASNHDEQLVPLCSLAASRAPPSTLAFA